MRSRGEAFRSFGPTEEGLLRDFVNDELVGGKIMRELVQAFVIENFSEISRWYEESCQEVRRSKTNLTSYKL